MRIKCATVDDFIANIAARAESGSNGTSYPVYQRAVYINRIRRPLNGRTPRDATSFELLLQVSAVLDFGEGQALLECGEVCGIDRTTSSDICTEGSGRQGNLVRGLTDFCKQAGLVVLPGVLDM